MKWRELSKKEQKEEMLEIVGWSLIYVSAFMAIMIVLTWCIELVLRRGW